MDAEALIHFLKAEAFASARRGSVPEFFHMVKRHIIDLIAMCIKNYQKRNTALSLELFHKTYLMFMDILKAERVRITLLGIKTHRDPLHSSDIIHRTFLVKIRQRNMAFFFIYLVWA